MWNMRKDKAAYALVESIVSLLLLSLILLTLLVPMAHNFSLLADKQAEAEHWRFMQDSIVESLRTGRTLPSQRISMGQDMEVHRLSNGKGLILTYTSSRAEGKVEILYEDE